MQSIPWEMVPLLQVILSPLVCSVAQLRCFIVYLELVTFWDGLGTNHCIYLRYPPTHVSSDCGTIQYKQMYRLSIVIHLNWLHTLEHFHLSQASVTWSPLLYMWLIFLPKLVLISVLYF